MIKKLKAAGLGYNVDDDKAIDKFGKSEKEAISLKLSSALIRLSFKVCKRISDADFQNFNMFYDVAFHNLQDREQ